MAKKSTEPTLSRPLKWWSSLASTIPPITRSYRWMKVPREELEALWSARRGVSANDYGPGRIPSGAQDSLVIKMVIRNRRMAFRLAAARMTDSVAASPKGLEFEQFTTFYTFLPRFHTRELTLG
jgi:hypothetical protein